MTSLKMTSEEALEIIKKYDDYAAIRFLLNGVLSPKTMGSPNEEDFKEAIDVIEQDLKVLEILKYRIHLKDSVIKNDMKEYEVSFIEASGFVFKNSEEYKLLKGWLEDE